jgi:mono/diheme cytochrome c family protein
MKRLSVVMTAALLPLTSLFAGAPTAPQGERSAPLLYRKLCSDCHGRDGQADTAKGKKNHARNLADPAWQDDASDERIFNSIMNGRKVRGNMPSFDKRLSQKEVESLVTFIRGLRK